MGDAPDHDNAPDLKHCQTCGPITISDITDKGPQWARDFSCCRLHLSGVG